MTTPDTKDILQKWLTAAKEFADGKILFAEFAYMTAGAQFNLEQSVQLPENKALFIGLQVAEAAAKAAGITNEGDSLQYQNGILFRSNTSHFSFHSTVTSSAEKILEYAVSSGTITKRAAEDLKREIDFKITMTLAQLRLGYGD